MKQAVMTSPGVIEFREVPAPEPAAGELLLRMKRIGVCGSDIHVYHGKHALTPFPVVQGHEVSATIEVLGEACDPGLRVGQRVALWPLTPCGRCYPCRVGRSNVCSNFELIGIHVDGGLQERFTVASDHAFPIDAPPELAALVEPVSIAMRAMHRGRVDAGERVVILGAGVMHGSGETFSDQGTVFSVQLVDLYASTLGSWMRPVVYVAMFTTMFSTSLTVVDGFPRAIARSVCVVRSGLQGTPDDEGPVYWISVRSSEFSPWSSSRPSSGAARGGGRIAPSLPFRSRPRPWRRPKSRWPRPPRPRWSCRR